ncbi:MAG TPA: dynamin family protein [Accumulibacter sp.]|uniref:dynamin family protein n=2 Tax=Accumulibacter sp. TaxID=2053492 RepID=UPI0026151B64|nr:dynamin family protein [Accumulibacter sp.]MDS4055559.1 dynamin family protein [Accumulibacter sp.]HND38622.1 dynamin family protein [Accumulibacter sp.]HNE38465.1 dynamin family protein [Accumulibacter sp.]HNG15096.1 dynamin family protein [Accumulibacter sp.]HNH91670.1 dynamin family protein [Accumulibacter sp.]
MLVRRFAAYSEWRTHLSDVLEQFAGWLSDNELSDAQTDRRLAHLLENLREDRLHIAFVAEFSRGKSELINAIFFADYGHRILPSTAGRTTMCPTELMFDRERPPSIELLPIETRASTTSISEYKRRPDEWISLPLPVDSAEAMQQTLRHVSDTTRVDPASAERLGFTVANGDCTAFQVESDGSVEIPCWRHAIINFPHPLLEQGLVILDTPGLNAIGTEPELTLSLLPNAHAVLFILAADTGVTQSDLTVWREHIGASSGRKKGRIVVLNKIDTLWDELRSRAQIEAEINKQIDNCAWTLSLPSGQVFPVSAQKALLAKINGDEDLLLRSRLTALERALSSELIPAKQEIIRDNTESEFVDCCQRTRSLLESRLVGLREQVSELAELRGKNKGVVEYMMGKVRQEKEEFETGLQHYYAVRSVFSRLTNNLFAHLGLDSLRLLTTTTREAMANATFSHTLSAAMNDFFSVARGNLADSKTKVGEILTMMEAIYKKFAVEHGLKLGTPGGFSLSRYEKELDRLDRWCGRHINTLFQLLTHEKSQLTQRFFEEVAVQVRKVFERANRDTESWLKSIMAPLEIQIREHQIQLQRRLESIKRIHQATDTLEERIDELVHVEHRLINQLDTLDDIARRARAILQQVASDEDARDAA